MPVFETEDRVLLRVEPTRNGQQAGIRWAAQYQLHPPE